MELASDNRVWYRRTKVAVRPRIIEKPSELPTLARP
eukprot:SAG31_NODE_38823_length_293_cov_0.783505_1_plen_35_part_10